MRVGPELVSEPPISGMSTGAGKPTGSSVGESPGDTDWPDPESSLSEASRAGRSSAIADGESLGEMFCDPKLRPRGRPKWLPLREVGEVPSNDALREAAPAVASGFENCLRMPRAPDELSLEDAMLDARLEGDLGGLTGGDTPFETSHASRKDGLPAKMGDEFD